MARLTRLQQQERTRTAVLAAARREFTENGFLDGKVDRIAERAGLTRGAVYSNFPGKRALYLAVLVDLVEHSPEPVAARRPPGSAADAAEAFARGWLGRLPLVGDPAQDGRLRLRSLSGLLDDDHLRHTLAQLLRLEALLLGLALESCGDGPRRVRAAELILTMLHGTGSLAESAPGFADPFDVIHACRALADLEPDDRWDPLHAAYVAAAVPADEPWSSPINAVDALTDRPFDVRDDGVIVVLGAHRLGAAEEAVRAARSGDRVTIVAATGDPPEPGLLIRLRIADLARCVRTSVGADPWPGLRLVLDDHDTLSVALGVAGQEPGIEAAVRVRTGRIAARASGRGAGHAAAVADHGRPDEGPR